MESKRVAVLITCYDRVDTTLECLRRLYVQEIPEGYSFDVWLVDDASPDKTGKKVKNEYPQVNVVQSSGNLFWSKGMRLAWDKAAESYDYDFYLWLNDDVMLMDFVIVNLVKDITIIEKEGWREYVIAGPMVTDESCEKLCYGCYDSNGVHVPSGVPELLGKSYSMCGNFVLIPNAVYKKLGPISDAYSHAYGDLDYRCLIKKFKVRLYSTSVICGVCPPQPERYVSLAKLNIKERLKTLCNPKGYSLRDLFIYRYRNFGILRALISVTHVFCRVLVNRPCRFDFNCRKK